MQAGYNSSCNLLFIAPVIIAFAFFLIEILIADAITSNNEKHYL